MENETSLLKKIMHYHIGKFPAKIIEYRDFDRSALLECPVCGWQGNSIGNMEYYDDLLDVSCPVCDKMLLVVGYPLVKGVAK